MITSFEFSNESTPRVALITFFRRKLLKLHKNDTILDKTFSLKQWETCTSSGLRDSFTDSTLVDVKHAKFTYLHYLPKVSALTSHMEKADTTVLRRNVLVK